MAEAGVNQGPAHNLGAEISQSRSQSIQETEPGDSPDATNVNLLNVSVTLSISNSGNRVSQDQNLQFVREQQQPLGQSGQTPVAPLRLRRVFSSTLSSLRTLLEALSLALCRR